ncbi:MAG: 16S rRNA (uracil(1498)-N(3))-methyltransferase [Chthoniobacterales bacterium]|nr:16S rRNA (uracil(1498)-N(3))-methyltransferase [Chthoniobacterales bacterium]
MSRFYMLPAEFGRGRGRLSAEEYHHARDVLRLGVGEFVEVFDGCGNAKRGRLLEGGYVKLLEELPGKRMPVSLILAQAVPKGRNFDFIVQKAVELGVSRIVPLITERTVPRFNGREGERKREKWRRVALEACKQCGQNLLPEVGVPVELGSFLKELPMAEFRMVGSLYSGAKRIRRAIEECCVRLGRMPKSGMVLIGPEGDFTPKECEAAVQAGFEPVTFGPIVLRTETAAIYALSILGYELMDMGSDSA